MVNCDPYKFVFNLFFCESLRNVPLTKENREKIVFFFKSWVGETFTKTFYFTNERNNVALRNILIFYLKNEKISENIYLEYEKRFKRVLNFQWEYNDEINYYNFYDFEIAKLVFQFFRKSFYEKGIDPFSFSDKILSDDDRKVFLHET